MFFFEIRDDIFCQIESEAESLKQIQPLIRDFDIEGRTTSSVLHRIILGQHRGDFETELLNSGDIDSVDSWRSTRIWWTAARGDV